MKHEKGKTLAELDVKPGDVVYFHNPINGGPGNDRTFIRFTSPAKVQAVAEDGDMVADMPFWFLRSRANRPTPTRDQLDAQIAELTAQRDALPETVRVYAGNFEGVWGFSRHGDGGRNHYRDFPLIDGVPEGFVEIARQSDCAEVTK